MQVLPLVGDTIHYVNEAYESGKRVLVEGANATMLDLDFGTYPFVTSSNPSIGGVAAGLGLAPSKFEAIIGVVSLTGDLEAGEALICAARFLLLVWGLQSGASQYLQGQQGFCRCAARAAAYTSLK